MIMAKANEKNIKYGTNMTHLFSFIYEDIKIREECFFHAVEKKIYIQKIKVLFIFFSFYMSIWQIGFLHVYMDILSCQKVIEV